MIKVVFIPAKRGTQLRDKSPQNKWCFDFPCPSKPSVPVETPLQRILNLSLDLITISDFFLPFIFFGTKTDIVLLTLEARNKPAGSENQKPVVKL
jgi:hypothetical protein